MKTQDEIEDMKNDLGMEIQETLEKINKLNDVSEIVYLSNINRQRMAQYNILLEVLK